MMTRLTEKQRVALIDELRKLKHLQKTRMLSLDDGGFVRDVVSDMDARIREIECLLAESEQGL